MEFLSRTYGIAPYYEPNEENPYLPDFYQDMKRWAFRSQLYFLSNKFRIHQAMDRMPGVVVLDRTIFEDAEVFATALHRMKCIDDRDWSTYRSFYEAILDAIQPPDLMIYLTCSLKTLQNRIRARGRPMEKDLPRSYLKRLDALYAAWIANYDMSDVLVLDTENKDYVHDLVHKLDIMERIEGMLPAGVAQPSE